MKTIVLALVICSCACTSDKTLLAHDISVLPVRTLLSATGGAFADADSGSRNKLVRGSTHWSGGRIIDAIESFEAALNYDWHEEQYAVIFFVLGHLYGNASFWAAAEEAFRRVGSPQLRHAAIASIGRLQLTRGLTAAAITAFDASLHHADSYFPALHGLGVAHIIAGDVEKGIEFWHEAAQSLERDGILKPADDGNQGDEWGSPASHSKPGAAASAAHVSSQFVSHVLKPLSPHSSDWLNDAGAVGTSLRSMLRRLHTLDLASLQRSLGLRLMDAGVFDEGLAHIRKAMALNPSEYGHMLLYCMLSMPLVFSSMEEVYAVRSNIARNVREALEDRLVISQPERLVDLYSLTHQLPYTGLPSHLLMKDVARLFASSEQPILEAASPDLYRSFPFALSHATSNRRWRSLSPHRYGLSASTPSQIPASAFVRQKVDDYFVLGERRRGLQPFEVQESSGDTSGAITSNGEMTSQHRDGRTSNPPRAPNAIIRVGILSYQIHDCPVGNLILKLISHLQGYSAAQAQVMMGGGADACGWDDASSGGDEVNGLASGGDHGFACSFVEGPSAGGGTRPRYLKGNLSNWNADLDELGHSEVVSRATADPMHSFGYVTIPGVAAFNITLFRLHYGGDNTTRLINSAADHVVMLPSRPFSLEQARQAVIREKLDVLIASDPGLQPELYTLMFNRMAPMQVAYWGVERQHTLSLGLPDTVDYYVVGDEVAEDKMQESMAEQVVRLGDLGVFFSPPRKPTSDTEKFATIARYGLLESRRTYLCPQTLNGIHPHFDEVILRILHADDNAEILILYEDGQDVWRAKLQARLQATVVKLTDLSTSSLIDVSMTRRMFERIRFIKDWTPNRYRDKWALMAVADVVLDTFPVGVGTSALDVLEVGTPIITIPSRQPLRQFTAAVLRRMGLADDLVADSMDDYVSKAVRIATDSFHRRTLRSKIMSRRAAYQWLQSQSSDPTGLFGLQHISAIQRKQRSSLSAWRDLRDHVYNVSGITPEVAAETLEWARRTHAEGYGDAGLATLNDWMRFLGRIGRPWAEDREATELEAASVEGFGGASGAKTADDDASEAAAEPGSSAGRRRPGKLNSKGKAAAASKHKSAARKPAAANAIRPG